MSTFTATASLKYWAGSAAAVSGQARSGYYNGTPYSGFMVFSVASLGDMSNVNINSVKLTLTIGSLGGAYTKDIIPTYGGRDHVIGTYSKAGCRNTTWTQTWTTGTNFNNLKAYFEGLTGGKAYLGVVSHSNSRGSGGQAYDYDYLNITKATLELVYGEKKSTGTVGDLKINSANGNSATLKITRYNSNYKHNVTWKIDSHSSTVTQTTSTSVPMLVPPGWLPNATSGTVTVTLETLDANNNSLGSNTYSFKATIEDVAALRPSIGTMDVSPQYTGVSNAAQGWGLYIQNKTKARLAATSLSAGAGATVSSYQITTSPSYGSASKTGITASSTSTTQFDTNTLTASGSAKITLKVTDSRGRSTEATVTKTVYAYASPMISNAKAERCNSSGTAQPTSGTYAKITLDYSCSGVNSNNKVATVAVTVKGKTNTPVSGGTAASGSTSTVIGGDSGTTYGLETDTAYNAEIAVTDKVGTVTKVNITVPSAAYTMHIKKGGKAIGFGMAADQSNNNRLDTAWPIWFSGGVTGNAAKQTRANLQNIRTFRSVTELGLTAGSATILTAFNALPDNAVLVAYAADFASGETPNTYGVVEMVRKDNARAYIHFYGKGESHATWRMYEGATAYNGNESNAPTGDWKRVYDETSFVVESFSLTFSGGTATYTFSKNVNLIGCHAVANAAPIVASRTSGFTGYKFTNVGDSSYSGTLTVEVFYTLR